MGRFNVSPTRYAQLAMNIARPTGLVPLRLGPWPAIVALVAVSLGLLTGCGSPSGDESGDSPASEAAPAGPGADVLGQDISAWLPEIWVGEPVPLSGAGASRATLLRFWTDTCPFCEASLPALQALQDEFGSRGLTTVGVYHPKPPRFMAADQVAEAAHERGFHGPLALDLDWASLQRIWLDGGPRSATSASFLVDADGRVRFVHPGPEFHPSDDPAHSGCQADYDALRQAITALLDD
jgi:thiol-disulfide isomerase/thioredoxin